VPGLQDETIAILARKGLRRLEAPVVLASGQESRFFVDGKAAVADGRDLAIACRALLERVGEVDFDAVGGLTMGADPLAHGLAMLTGREWFVVRKEPKGRGTNQRVEGARITPGTRVLLVDDVVTTGGSIRAALAAVEALGGRVVAAAALVDRGEATAGFFAERGIPYAPVATYADLGIPPVGRELTTA
jgi:orotate phosphoribosyltransferase